MSIVFRICEAWNEKGLSHVLPPNRVFTYLEIGISDAHFSKKIGSASSNTSQAICKKLFKTKNSSPYITMNLNLVSLSGQKFRTLHELAFSNTLPKF